MAALSLSLLQMGAKGPETSADKPTRDWERDVVAEPQLPVRFDANHGQTDAEVKFLARGFGYSLFLTRAEFVLRLPAARQSSGAPGEDEGVLRLRPIGANPDPRVAGVQQLAGHANYLMGDDRSRWTRGVPGYAKVRYGQLYPGIDMVFHGSSGKVEYDFAVSPGADPNLIGLAVTGATHMAVSPQGELVLDTAAGQLRQPKPVVYQQSAGRKRLVEGAYVIGPGDRVGFRVGAYDPTRTLVIDPVLPFSTQLGGGGDDGGHAVVVDKEGNSYVTGWTSSPDFPKQGSARGFSDASGVQTVLCRVAGRGGPLAGGGSTTSEVDPLLGGGGCGDVFVAKLSPDGSKLLYSTYLGGAGAESGVGIAVDSAGSAHAVGFTTSRNFPTTKSGFRTTPDPAGLPEVFVAKLDPTGAELAYSTYLGGSFIDSGNGIALDRSDKVYVAGVAGPGLATTKGAFQASPGGVGSSDAFVAKLDPTASGPASLVYATYLGGPGIDTANGVAVDSTGNAYVTGLAGGGFPTKNPFQPAFGGRQCKAPSVAGTCPDAFVAKLNPSGTALLYATYLGGEGDDSGTGIAVDSSENAYVTGTAGAGFPTKNAAFNKPKSGNDAFVAKLTKAGSALVYSTYLGGTGYEAGNAIALDSKGKAYVVGTIAPALSTTSVDFPVKSALQAAKAGGADTDAFIATLDPARSGAESLVFSTYFGGAADDAGNGIAVDPSGAFVVTGATQSFSDFPITNALQPRGKGDSDAFVAKVTPDKEGGPAVTEVMPRSGPPSGGTRVVLTGRGLAKATRVSFGQTSAVDFRASADGTTMVVRAPAHEPGEVVVSVTTDAGQAEPTPGARFTYASGLWSETGAPKLDRSWPTAVRLADGKVLLAGGCLKRVVRNDVCAEATATAELYDPARRTWSPTGDMTIARHSGFAATLLADGKVLVVGGNGPLGEVLDSAELYDPRTGTWSATAPRPGPPPAPNPDPTRRPEAGPPQGLQQFSATPLPDGKVLVVGDAISYLYDPATGTRIPTGDRAVPFPFDHTATLLTTGLVFVAGGDTTVLYDPASGKWLATAPSPIPRINKTVTSLSNGQLLIVGGRTSLVASDFSASTEFYDPNAPNPKQPGTKGGWKPARSLAVGRYGHATTALADGRLLVVGGTYSEGGRLDAAELYDPTTGQWSLAGVLGTPRGQGVTATPLKDGTVLVAGSGGSAEIFDPNPKPDTTPLVAANTQDDTPTQGSSDSAADGFPVVVATAVASALALVVLIVVIIRRRRRRQPPPPYTYRRP